MLLSPDCLIADISGDRALPFDLPQSSRGMIKALFKKRPGLPVKTPLLDTQTNFYLPLHPPRLAMEYLERCALLFSECTRLRDRIEALQLDIFNLKQSVKAHEAEQNTHRPRMRALWVAEEERLKAQSSERAAVRSLIQSNATSIDDATRRYPPKATGGADDAWANVNRIIDGNRLNAELLVENSAVNELAYQIDAAASSRARVQAHWETEDQLYRDKVQMLGVGGRLALEARLAGALFRYSSLMADLKEYMFSAEWGLEHVFGVWTETPWEELDVDAYADEKIDAPLDGLGERLIRLSNAAYGFQLLENAFAVSVRAELERHPSGQLVGTLRLPLPGDTKLAFVRRIRLRGPVVRSASVEIRRGAPFATQGNRELPDWLARDATADELATWRPVYAAAIEGAAAPALADMSSAIAMGQLCSAPGDSEGYITDRTLSYTSAAGDWLVTVSSPDNEAILGHGLWLDVITSRTRVV